ncbi:hypothetical protein ABTA81_19630, partial [Acinetobacter baumannii]
MNDAPLLLEHIDEVITVLTGCPGHQYFSSQRHPHIPDRHIAAATSIKHKKIFRPKKFFFE